MILWQNDNTVVIGRNQNPWSECSSSLLEEEGVRLARRYSGGGAVYHDMGNLNFSFICSEEDYNQEKQFQVILQACKRCGIDAYLSGRNDILVDGRKFSGNAFIHQSGFSCHHGTIMVNSEFGKLSRYLTPSKAKLQAKGVRSVRSRVANLSEFCPNLNVAAMKVNLIAAFTDVYGLPAEKVVLSDADEQKIHQLEQALEDPNWVYGAHPPISCTIDGRFPWGGITLYLGLENGYIQQLNVYTDSLDWTLAAVIQQALHNWPFNKDAILSALKNAVSPEILSDIASILDI